MSCRLLYLVGQLGPGGSERQLWYLMRSLDRKRYRPAVVIWNYRDEDVYVPRLRRLGIPLHVLPNVPPLGKKLSAFRRLVRLLEPEVVHSYCFYLNFAAHYSVRSTRAVALGSVRSDYILDRQSNPWWIVCLSGRWPRHQICNSFVATENLGRSKNPFVPHRSFVVRNGLDLQYFCQAPPPRSERVYILGVGSLLPVKRWDRALEAARTLKQRGFNFVVRIAGSGPLGRSLEQEVERLDLADHVKFLGYVDDVLSLLRNSTFLVHTSDSEGCPNAVMEAMACGRAVLATDAGDIPHLVEDGKTGFVVRRGDDATLVERMAALISDGDLCCRMGEASRVKAEREFGLDRLVTETLMAYRAAGWKDA